MNNTVLTKINNFEGREVEIILGEDNEPQFELYSLGMALGYTRTVNSKGKEYFQCRKDRIEKVLKNGSITGLYHDGKTYLTEEQVYDFMFEAHTEPCKRFKKWLSNEVLPSIRKYGVYQDREEIDTNYLKYNYKALKETFSNSPIENLLEDYISCLKWYKDTKYRVPYGTNSKKRSDATHTLSDSKVMMMRKIVTVLEDRSLKLLENNKFGSVYEIDNAIKEIKDNISKQNNLSNRGKLGQATKKINKLKDEVNYHNPSIDEFVEIPVHGFSVNYMFDDYIDDYGKLKKKRSEGYNRWINKFPNYILKDNFYDIDLNKPTKLWLKFDAVNSIDTDNLIKSCIDQITRGLGFEDDNNISLGSVEINKRVKNYSEGKIYILLKNID